MTSRKKEFDKLKLMLVDEDSSIVAFYISRGDPWLAREFDKYVHAYLSALRKTCRGYIKSARKGPYKSYYLPKNTGKNRKYPNFKKWAMLREFKYKCVARTQKSQTFSKLMGLRVIAYRLTELSKEYNRTSNV